MKILAASRTFIGATATEVVSKMREEFNRWNPNTSTTSNEEYMKGVVARFGGFGGIGYIGITEEEKCSSFIESLIRANLAENMSD